MLLSPDKLAAAMEGCTKVRARQWAPALSEACELYRITTEPRLAAFIAQVGHESAALSRTTESLNYSPERLREVALKSPTGSRWRSILPRVRELARQPVKLAEAVYGGRMGNGPEGTGDGYRYRGRGPMQTTGKANYESLTQSLLEIMTAVPDFTRNPELLEQVRWGALAAAVFWHDNELNELADAGDINRISRRVNGGPAGLNERAARFRTALNVLTA